MKCWVSTKKLVMKSSRKPTGNLHWSSIQTKIMHPEQQRPLKVTLSIKCGLYMISLCCEMATWKCKCLDVWHCDECLCPCRFQWNIMCVLLPEIGNAYAVLSNPDKRRQYDLVGSEEPSSPGHSHRGGFDFHRGFEADITPDDLFNMFFGGGFPSCKRTSVCGCTLPEL